MQSPIFHQRAYRCRHLPHLDIPNGLQFITYRLWDSIPHEKILEIKAKVARVPEERQRNYMGFLMEQWLNNGSGCGILVNKDVYSIILNDWFQNNHIQYQIIEWVIMPNHVHLLVRMFPEYRMGDIVHFWKSFTSHKIKQTASYQKAIRNNPEFNNNDVWFQNYFDRAMRGPGHINNTRRYILRNPIGLFWQGKLVEKITDWPLSSASNQWQKLIES